jgi:hypothetical protein
MSPHIRSTVAGVLAALASIIGGTGGNIPTAKSSELILSFVAGAVAYLAGILIDPKASAGSSKAGPPYELPAAYPAAPVAAQPTPPAETPPLPASAPAELAPSARSLT